MDRVYPVSFHRHLREYPGGYNQDGRLDYKVDRIIKTRYDSATSTVKVDKYVDSDGDGLPNDQNGDNLVTTADCNPCAQLLSDIKPIWEAGKQLALKDSSTRTILTWVDSNHDGVVNSGEQIPFTTANEATLGPTFVPRPVPRAPRSLILCVAATRELARSRRPQGTAVCRSRPAAAP